MLLDKTYILAFLLLPAVSYSQILPDNYLGHYVPQNEFFREDSIFLQVDLHVDSVSAPLFYARVVFISADSLGGTTWCDSQELFYNGDSLMFRTMDCQTERYEFFGRFIQHYSYTEDNYQTPILEGYLEHYKDNKKLYRKRVRLEWVEGC